MTKYLFFLFVITLTLKPVLAFSTETKAPPEVVAQELVNFQVWKAELLKKRESGEIKNQNYPYVNELILSHSPYLKQHAHNPINWKPWREPLFEQAKRQNKLIFLSIGYSTCHWCHVMEKESFNDLELAKILNEKYISIKVDREELPHIDDYFSAALVEVKGSAGWPITAIINAEGLPVFIDSYLSKDKLKALLNRIENLWNTQSQFLNAGAKNIDAMVSGRHKLIPTKGVENYDVLASINEKLLSELDSEYGGFKGETKFPSEVMLLYILDQLKRKPDKELETLLTLQLEKMLANGMYDSIEGGFFRYAGSRDWGAPHYEKMLYTQAQLIMVYSQAYEYFGDLVCKEIANQTIDFLMANFYREKYGFLSAIDADLNGEEGGYYLFDKHELTRLNANDRFFNTYQSPDSDKLGLKYPILLSNSKFTPTNEYAQKLSALRANKESPHVDTKVLTGWNGLTIKSLVEAARNLDRPELLGIAEHSMNLLWRTRFDDSSGVLRRTGYFSDKNQVVFLEDYAYLSSGLIALYDYTEDESWLTKASLIVAQAIQRFSNKKTGFNSTAGGSGKISLNKTADNELPSASSVLIDSINKLDNRLGKTSLKKEQADFPFLLMPLLESSSLDHLNSARVLNSIVYGSADSTQYFASGKGKLTTNCLIRTNKSCQKLALSFRMKPGWHINSNTPLQDYLIATNLIAKEPIELTFPQAKLVKLGFQDDALSIYEGEFKIVASKHDSNLQPLRIKLYLQACSDDRCLQPEILNITL